MSSKIAATKIHRRLVRNRDGFFPPEMSLGYEQHGIKVIITVTETEGVRARRCCQSTSAAALFPALLVGSLGDGYEFALFPQLPQSLLRVSNPATGHQSRSSQAFIATP